MFVCVEDFRADEGNTRPPIFSPRQRNDGGGRGRGRSDFCQVRTHETRKLRSRVTMAYSGRAHGIEMKRYESRGNRLRNGNTGIVLLNNSALPSVDPRPFRQTPHGSHPPRAVSRVSGKTADRWKTSTMAVVRRRQG